MAFERGVFARAVLVAALLMSLVLVVVATKRPALQITAYLTNHAR
jgi:hypothetical protein